MWLRWARVWARLCDRGAAFGCGTSWFSSMKRIALRKSQKKAISPWKASISKVQARKFGVHSGRVCLRCAPRLRGERGAGRRNGDVVARSGSAFRRSSQGS